MESRVSFPLNKYFERGYKLFVVWKLYIMSLHVNQRCKQDVVIANAVEWNVMSLGVHCARGVEWAESSRTSAD